MPFLVKQRDYSCSSPDPPGPRPSELENGEPHAVLGLDKQSRSAIKTRRRRPARKELDYARRTETRLSLNMY